MWALLGAVIGLGIVVAPPMYVVWLYKLGGKGKAIRAKFQAAGALKGKTVAQINAIGGKPLSMVTQGDKQVGTWGHVGYNIVLVFRGGVCEGVNKEVTF